MMPTTNEALCWSLEDAGALQALGVCARGVDACLQLSRHHPLRKPVQLAVAQETIARDLAGDTKRDLYETGETQQ